MGLGTSIFLSSILLGIVVIFIFTKDRWNWKKIIVRFIVSILVALISTIIIFIIYEKITERPKIEKEFLSLTLDLKKSEILFLKGEPNEREEDDKVWIYDNYFIIFKDDKIRMICYYEKYFGPNIQGLGIGKELNEILHKFGEPSSISISKNKMERTYCFSKYNVFFVFEKNIVKSYGIYNSQFGPLQYRE